MSQNRRMPTHDKIYQYWKDLLNTRGIEVGEEETCFACGDGITLKRAHILPRNQGGADTVDNLHILCQPCHLESEFLTGEEYWERLTIVNQGHWQFFFQHTLKRLQRRGFKLERFEEILRKNRIEEASNYLAKSLLVAGESKEEFYLSFQKMLEMR